MISLKNAIESMIEISQKEMDTFMSFCYKKSFKKKEILSDDDKFIDEVYFIEKGILRVKIIDLEGTEHTTHFAIENQFIADYNAFLTQQKSRYLLEAMENTDVIVLPRKAIEWGYTNMSSGQKLGRLIAEYYFIYMDTRIQNLYTLSPIERYKLMDEIFPKIHNRVPQHMIASYLGITPIHLSRIKKQLL
ncbi:Crp/Fnr family transcriptional regulator [Winogradskyella poriferorum]|uniref:Crp/Fnr family transcriptional regulator n=1 Tax=Winogradskyella poriferorum TaxID=307627 RepID=UPI003D648E57